MNLDFLQLDYSPWLLLACVLLGIAYAVFFYYRSHLREFNSRWKIIGLALIRGFVVAVLAFLLLGPVIRYFETHTEEPRLVVAIDNSQSMIAPEVADSTSVTQRIRAIMQKLNAQFKLDILYFTDEVTTSGRLDFDGTTTDIDAALTYVKSRYEGIPLAGIVLMTDGIYNRGANPIYDIPGLKSPIYPVPFGDTTQKSDIKIAQVLHNKIAYLGDKFPIEVDVLGEKMRAGQELIQLYEINAEGKRKLLTQKKLNLHDGIFFQTVEFQAIADEVGVQHLRVVVPPVAGEITEANNYRDIFIDVIDSRQKIAIIASAPHPDIGALYAALKTFKNYEVDRFILPEKPDLLSTYDLLILHQVPSVRGSAVDLIQSIKKKKLPVLWIVGSQTDLKRLNAHENIVQIHELSRKGDKAQAYADPSFNYFKLEEQFKESIEIFPPLDVPYAKYELGSGSQMLLKQKIGEIETEKPLIIVRDYNNRKSALITGEGLWRWKGFDYMENSANTLFDNFISQLVKYLGTSKDLRRFRVDSEKRIYDENEPVRFSASIYNDAYQFSVEPTITLTIRSEGKQYDYTFTPMKSNYSLDAGFFKPGTYRWEAEATFDGSHYTEHGQFTVKQVQREYLNLQADYALLNELADKSGGALWDGRNLDENINALKASPYANEVQYSSEKNQPLISIEWIGGLLALLLLLEWLFRRLMGDY